jgi:V/A-type H+-transporting ATPase subunit I
MGISNLEKISLVAPRSEIHHLLRELSDFKLFHVDKPENNDYDPQLQELSNRSFKLYIYSRDLINKLDIQTDAGIIEILKKGYNVNKATFKLNNWEELVDNLELSSKELSDSFTKDLESLTDIESNIESNTDLLATLGILSSLNIDFKDLSLLKNIKILPFISDTKSITEITKSISDLGILQTTSLSDDKSLVLIATRLSNIDKVDKILRAFNCEKFSIPDNLPQNPIDAFKTVDGNLKQLQTDKQTLQDKIQKNKNSLQQKIISLYEASYVGYSSIENIKRTGTLQRFVVINGFIPSQLKDHFTKRFSKWIVISEKLSKQSHGHSAPNIPTLMTNKSVTKSFESIALSKGPPNYNELDPTAFVSLTFPIFYGMMFGDVGHGLVLLLFGLLLLYRKAPNLNSWGKMLSLSGIVAIFFGFLIGEFFGIEIYHYVHAFGHPPIHFVDRIHAIPSINIHALKLLLKISILFGIVHIYSANLIGIYNSIKNKEYDEVIMEQVPVVMMYTGFVFLMFAFLGTGYKIDALFSSPNDTPLFFFLRQFSIASVATYSSLLLFLGFVLFIIIKPIFIITGRLEKESIFMVALINIIDGGIEKIAGSLSNTLSYTRLAVLLTVHSSLLIVVNLTWSLPLVVAVPLFIFFNILVILLEGMIVYIQDLRLHLYEWMSKFYSGSGKEFRSFIHESEKIEIEWT